MTKGTLPPQAYTREILTQAYQWMHTQPESIRKLADSADALVGLFLRAKRSGDANLETSVPASTENFRANLKTLAAELEQFSSPNTSLGAPTSSLDLTESRNLEPKKSGPQEYRPPTNFVFAPKSKISAESSFEESNKDAPSFVEGKNWDAHLRNGFSHTNSNNSAGIFTFESLDPKSRAIVSKVQNRFNLSSENEALRLLISLGAERIEKL